MFQPADVVVSEEWKGRRSLLALAFYQSAGLDVDGSVHPPPVLRSAHGADPAACPDGEGLVDRAAGGADLGGWNQAVHLQ